MHDAKNSNVEIALLDDSVFPDPNIFFVRDEDKVDTSLYLDTSLEKGNDKILCKTKEGDDILDDKMCLSPSWWGINVEEDDYIGEEIMKIRAKTGPKKIKQDVIQQYAKHHEKYQEELRRKENEKYLADEEKAEQKRIENMKMKEDLERSRLAYNLVDEKRKFKHMIKKRKVFKASSLYNKATKADDDDIPMIKTERTEEDHDGVGYESHYEG